MQDQTTRAVVSRRTLLYGTAAAGAAVLAGCGGGGRKSNGNGNGSKNNEKVDESSVGSADPNELQVPGEYKQAPMLQEMEDAGDIPPIAERLPENPYVIPHNWLTEGKFGGTLRMIATASDAGNFKEIFYGSSPLRYLNDGMDIAPGLVESWDSNDDASEWTFNFRKGLRWSDGEPWTVNDVMFWWEDMILDEGHEDTPPDETKSGKGTVATLEMVDDYTLKMTFDAPSPLTAERMAMWTNGTKGNGPKWFAPRHFAEQYHVKYNPKAGDDWGAAEGDFDKLVDFSKNPECPTMNAWMLESYTEGRNTVWVRNPYYWCVTREGAQMPYVDRIQMRVSEEEEVGKLQIYQGNVDIVWGQFYDLNVADIADVEDSMEEADTQYTLMDGGSGTGSMFFFNYDHKNEKMRELIREPKFRQALSFAFNRERVQKSIYFNTGEPTTGTLSPKALEYNVNDEGKSIYKQWRDLAVDYDPEKAKSLLDEIGVVEENGKRVMPDGGELKIILDHPADHSEEHEKKNNLLKEDWEAIGITVVLNPISPDAFGERWDRGDLDSRSSWEVGDGPTHLLYPQWLVPIEPSRWAPLEGQWYNLRGTSGADKGMHDDPFKRTPPRMEPDEGGPIEALWTMYDQVRVEPDEMERHRMVWEMIKIHIEHGPFFMGSVANPPRVVVHKNDLQNWPKQEQLALGGFANPWIHPTPAIYDPDTLYWENPEEHQG